MIFAESGRAEDDERGNEQSARPAAARVSTNDGFRAMARASRIPKPAGASHGTSGYITLANPVCPGMKSKPHQNRERLARLTRPWRDHHARDDRGHADDERQPPIGASMRQPHTIIDTPRAVMTANER